MDAKYEELFRLKVLDYTCYDFLAPHGVLDVFQDVAGKHATQYDMTFEQLLEKNMIWVLVKVKYRVIKNIPLYSKVKVTTWPKKKGLVDFDRETLITTVDGDVLIEGISKWVVVDINTRKIIPAKYVSYNAICPDDSLFDEKFTKIEDIDINDANHYQCKVEFCDVDHNNHTNNAKYACMILNALRLKKENDIKEFEINFVNETILDDVIDLHYKKIDNYYIVKAISNNKIVFTSKVSVN